MMSISGGNSIFSFDGLYFKIRLGQGDVGFWFMLETRLESGLVEAVRLILAERLKCLGLLMRLIFGKAYFGFEHQLKLNLVLYLLTITNRYFWFGSILNDINFNY